MESPKFPKLDDMVHPKTFALVESVVPPRKKEQGLFEGMLGGEVGVLFQDAVEHPDKYDDETVALLHRLVQGGKKAADLEEADLRLLDRAALDFASYVKPQAPSKPTQKVASTTRKEFEEPLEGFSEETMDVPDEGPDGWWM